MDWIMQTLTQLGEHFGLVLIDCVELAAAVALLIKGQHKKKGTPIQTAWGRGAEFAAAGTGPPQRPGVYLDAPLGKSQAAVYRVPRRFIQR